MPGTGRGGDRDRRALGEVPDGLLGDGETLAQRRRRELEASTSVLARIGW